MTDALTVQPLLLEAGDGLLSFFVDNKAELFRQTAQHLKLTLVALGIAIGLGLPLGVIIQRYQLVRGPILGFTSLLQTIPSLALLGFLLQLVGIGFWPSIIALFLYALLPIVQNTFTGLEEVDQAVVDAARGMGMTGSQRLARIELPLALPTIFAGIRTAAVINVGIATLCALIGGGGLGAFIFRGISLNNEQMIIGGALPAAALALVISWLLGAVHTWLSSGKPPWLAIGVFGALCVGFLGLIVAQPQQPQFELGMNSEFFERGDGYREFKKKYNLKVNPRELEHGILYKALLSGSIDAAVGYSTDGQIAANDLVVLEDDRRFFPPYEACPIVHGPSLEKFPKLRQALQLLEGKIDTRTMSELNARVDNGREKAKAVARDWLKSQGYRTEVRRRGAGGVVIGGKTFAEQYILAEMFAIVIENYTPYPVKLQTGLGGTKICFDALKTGEIDLYPEYTGTGLLAILEPEQATVDRLLAQPEDVYAHVKQQFREIHDITWLRPLGFQNNYAVITTEATAKELNLKTISDLPQLSAE